MKISNYLKLSKEANTINDIYMLPSEFKCKYKNLEGLERDALISHIILNNIPYVFRSKPILYEMIVKYLSDILEVNSNFIYLIGSGKTGFSISPGADYGKIFSESSDLDFTIVDKILFDKLAKEYELWSKAYLVDGKCYPKNEREKSYWDENILRLKKNIINGFLDTYKIPNIEICLEVKKINNVIYLISQKLNEYHQIKVKGISVRVYQDEESFINQLSLNTRKCLE